MRRLLLVFAVALGLVACRPRPVRVALPGRIVVLTDSLLDCGGTDTLRFGHLHAGETGALSLSFENRTSRPLVIASVERSCGCTSVEFDAAPFGPGDFSPVVAKFDSRGEWGWQLKVVDLFFAGRPRPFRLLVEADVE